jgi:hypothetical protein
MWKQFLMQTQYLQYEARRCKQRETGQFVYNVPFKFTIPRMLPSCDPNVTEHFLHLPPSLDEGEVRMTRDGRVCMQPLINYNIRAVVRFRGGADGPSMEMQGNREIPFIPFTEASPPLEIGDFPGEFLSISTQPLKISRFAAPFGEMDISMGEPQPLRFSTNGPSASTVSKLQLTLRLADAVASKVKPHTWSCTIESHILVKTFFSTVPMRSMPGNCLIDAQSRVQGRSDAMELATRTVAMTAWRLDWHSELEKPSQAGSAPWTMTLDLPVTVPSTLVPTFCSSLAARRYALRLRLKIKGLHHSTFVLVVPLQVIYCRQAGKAREETFPQSPPSWQDTGDASDVSDLDASRMDSVSYEYYGVVLLSLD